MEDFGKFCYLDVQKTGSTFISHLLHEASTIPVVWYDQHQPVYRLSARAVIRQMRKGNMGAFLRGAGRYRPSTIYFNSVRHPYKYYASLYNYGCDGRGGLYKTLAKKGFGELYDGSEKGFLNWIEFIMDGRNASALRKEYARGGGQHIGYLTFRFVRLSVPNPNKLLSGIQAPDDVFAIYQKNNICQFTIRNETMNEDLSNLATSALKPYLDLKKVEDILAGSRVNASASKAANAAVLEASPLAQLVQERDAFVFQQFYS